MAALCPGVQYGLSSQPNFGENKDLIFVKLTDSALRAIEDYRRNQNKFNSQNPTIKFLGNEGQLSFPSLHNGYTSFNFSISSTADMEGPGGSFECVQQSSPPRGSLEMLGPIPHKLRIHANDDIYEATRQRMTVAEENHKNKCTREIKPNQNDIGRKVKVKQFAGRPLPVTTRKDAPPTLRDTNITTNHNHNNNNSNNTNKSAYHHHPSPTAKSVLNANSGLLNGVGSPHVSSSHPQNKPSSLPDIARRPIKERLIHLLALRPFKKLELHERLTREGLREKNGMSSILKQISTMRDNSYYLNRAMWNDVREDWPFYTESERQILKRRKPQNLTPPGSSDGGSSGSGQSPTSTHPGSPPPIYASSKRPGYYDGADGLPTKRQRISHYRKPAEPVTATYRGAANDLAQRRSPTDSRDASNMNPRSRETTPYGGGGGGTAYASANTNNNNHSSMNGFKLSDDEDVAMAAAAARRRTTCDSNLGYGAAAAAAAAAAARGERAVGGVDRAFSPSPIKDDGPKECAAMKTPDTRQQAPPAAKMATTGGGGGGGGAGGGGRQQQQQQLSTTPRDWSKVTSTTQDSPESPPLAVCASEAGTPIVDSTMRISNSLEFPDYEKEYLPIKNDEQRRKYKADFNADYAEYRELHAIVEKVSRRFSQLKTSLKQQSTQSLKYKDIKRQIVREYQLNKDDPEHQRVKRRFQYLHEKLSYIKGLVTVYDRGVAKRQY